MKNAQNEYEKPAESLLSSTTTSTTAAATATTNTVVQLLPSPVVSPSLPIGISTEIAENAHKNNATAATAAAHATKMTDEQNNENNNESNSGNSVNNNGNLIAEAAKILLKNGLNGTSAAAAVLLTAATSFQLPTLPLPITTLATTATTTPLSRSVIDCGGNQLDPPPAHVGCSSKISTTMSSAVGHVPQRNNGLSSSTSHFKATTKDMGLSTSSGFGALGKSMSTTSTDAGVIDYTLGTMSNGTQKALSTTSTTGNSSAAGGYPPSGGGGRLQFFKDGKFILELARSKDGERGGWVSVPRKHFRQPSATTSTVTPASTANTCAYPKIESTTSLSFSDDNSSIQSSPWQRDHCWKQTTPKRNISKEMSVYFRLAKDITLTKEGLRFAKRKRRRPYDDSTNNVKGLKLFDRYESNSESKKSILCNNEKNAQSPNHRLQNGNSNSTIKNEEEDRCSTSSVATLIGENDSNDSRKTTEKIAGVSLDTKNTIKMESLSTGESTDDVTGTTECKAEAINSSFANKESNVKNETDETSLEVEKMNTSEDSDEKMLVKRNESQPIPETSTSSVGKVVSNTVDVDNAPTPVQSKTGVEEKRLNKRKVERAKLTSIVQKLIDRMPVRASILAKVPLSNNGSIAQNSNFLSNKVSPTSSSSTSPSLLSTSSGSATASRLVEYHHQQHVSPRKRILREFEKVSLEDTAATCGAGGKRSRAKSSANSAMGSNYRNARSPNNRVQSSVCSVPAVSIGSSSISTIPLNGESPQNTSSLAGTKHTKNTTTTNTQPTRLYSSYSIHSLLGDQSSSSSSGSSSTSAAPKKASEQPVFASNMTYHQHNLQQQNTEHSLYVRKSVSPKSPDAGGGKSPSSNAANKKRSPPYASPMHESLSRSPSVSNSIDYSPRATPPEFSLTAKQRYGAASTTEQQNFLQHHRHLQQGAFYSPYMMSPKYVPGSANIATGSSSPPSTSRSPRHSTTAFTSPTTSTTMSTTNQQNIPNTYSSHLAPPSQRELSPSHSLADFPRESTPRTVPKKTASIRRQFASPTASSHNTTNSGTSCPSPNERGSEELTSDCKTSSSVTSAAYQQLLQRSSPSAALSSSLHAAAYYMYPPAAPISFGNTGSGSNLSVSGSSPIAHAAQASAYIPSCYHSYLSALNITKHLYMGAGASQSAAARLSSPFHPMSIPYNGVNAATVAAAAAAAAAFSGQPHMGHHPMLPPPSAASAAFYGVGSGFGASLNASPLPTSAVPQSHKSTESNLAAMSADISAEDTMSTSATSTASTRSAQFSSNIKDEHSSDVPLNLSKH